MRNRVGPPLSVIAQVSSAAAPARTTELLPRFAQVPPFWLYKPPSGIDFYFNTTGTLAAGAGSTVILGGTPPIRLTSDYEGVIASVNIFLDAPTTAEDIIWTLRRNGGPIQGWDQLTTFPRVANNLSIEFSGYVQIPGNSLIDVLITNRNASGPWTVGVEVTGWSWPQIERKRTFGEGV